MMSGYNEFPVENTRIRTHTHYSHRDAVKLQLNTASNMLHTQTQQTHSFHAYLWAEDILPVYWFPSWIYTYYVELCFRNLAIRLYVLRIRIPDTWQNSVCRYALFIKLIYENGWVRQNEWRKRDVCKGFVYCILMVFTLLTCSSHNGIMARDMAGSGICEGMWVSSTKLTHTHTHTITHIRNMVEKLQTNQLIICHVIFIWMARKRWNVKAIPVPYWTIQNHTECV